jgi:hypothetical protein
MKNSFSCVNVMNLESEMTACLVELRALFFQGERAFVLGSAPKYTIPKSINSFRVLTVNGSQFKLEGFIPDLTLFNTSLIKSSFLANIEARKALEGLRTKRLIVVVGKISWRKRVHVLYRLFRLGYKSERLHLMESDGRERVLKSLLGLDMKSPSLPSNGVFLAVLACYLGASEVLMSGFSFSQAGHSYNNLSLGRGHVDADRIVLNRVLELGLPIFAIDHDFARDSGLRLIDIGSKSGLLK